MQIIVRHVHSYITNSHVHTTIETQGLVERIEIYTGSLQDYLAEPSSVMFDKVNKCYCVTAPS